MVTGFNKGQKNPRPSFMLRKCILRKEKRLLLNVIKFECSLHASRKVSITVLRTYVLALNKYLDLRQYRHYLCYTDNYFVLNAWGPEVKKS